MKRAVLLFAHFISAAYAQNDVNEMFSRIVSAFLPVNFARAVERGAMMGMSSTIGSVYSNTDEAAANILSSPFNTNFTNVLSNLSNLQRVMGAFDQYMPIAAPSLPIPFFGNRRTNGDPYDFIIVGAGAAGCVLARTLADEYPKKRILLLERGGDRNEHSWSELKVGAAILDPRISEEIFTTDGVRLNVGKVMGGGTAINGGLYIAETDEWLDIMEKQTGQKMRKSVVSEAYRWLEDESGLLTNNGVNRYADIRLKANVEAGFSPLINDTHTAKVTPGTWTTKTLFKGERRYAADILVTDVPNITIKKYAEVERVVFADLQSNDVLKSASRRSVKGKSIANCVEYRDSRSPGGSMSEPSTSSSFLGKVTGIPNSFSFNGDIQVDCIKPSGRIILSAGAIHSPAILMRSGVGPVEQVKKVATTPIIENPHVGDNFSDHMAFGFLGFWNGPYNDTTLQQVYSTGHGGADCVNFPPNTTNIDPTAKGCNFFLTEELSGGFMSMHYVIATMQRHAKTSNIPLVQDMVNSLRDCIVQDNCNPILTPIHDCLTNGVAFSTFLSQPKSRGTVTIDDRGRPVVNANYLSNPEDQEVVRTSVKMLLNIIDTPSARSILQRDGASCADYLNDLYYNPLSGLFLNYSLPLSSLNLTPEGKIEGITKPTDRAATIPPVVANPTDEQLDQVHNSHYGTIWHYVGTTAMGTVVDQEKAFTVMGTERLSICDAGVFPIVSRVNSMGVALMIGRYCAQMIIDENTSKNFSASSITETEDIWRFFSALADWPEEIVAALWEEATSSPIAPRP